MSSRSLENFWHPIGRAEEVTSDPKQFRLLGEQIVAYRDEAGVVAFKDLCIHRGAALSGGSVKDGVITCPYHGWSYDRTGACVGIPSLPEGAPIPKKARAIAYKACEAYDLVWVAMAEPTEPFPSWPDDAWDNPNFRVFLVCDYVWKTSAGRAVENAMDFSHFNFVHAGYTELADGPVIKPHDVTRTNHGLRYVYEDGRLRRDYTLEFPFILHDRKSVITIGQGGTWSEKGDSKIGDVTLLSFVATPMDAATTRVYSFIGRNHSLDKDDSDFTAGFDVIMDQDRRVVESQRPEEIPLDIQEELHLRYPDAASIAYRRMLREVAGAEAFQP